MFFRGRTGPNGGGLSRKTIMREIDGSLRRLGTDHVDLYQIHRWDPATPIEETLEALHDVVKAGKARYIGASSMYAWQFAKALYTADLHGWTRFVSMQNHYNLLHREEEREMLGLCADQGIGVIPWSPLARGRLTRDWDAESARTATDPLIGSLYAADDEQIVRRVAEIAAARGVSRAQVALAWMLGKPVVTAPLIGVTKIGHIDDAVAALDLELTAEEIASLEEPYSPRPIAGFQVRRPAAAGARAARWCAPVISVRASRRSGRPVERSTPSPAPAYSGCGMTVSEAACRRPSGAPRARRAGSRPVLESPPADGNVAERTVPVSSDASSKPV